MKRRILLILGLLIAGTFAYYGGYYLYTENNPKIELLDQEALQKSMPGADSKDAVSEEYYIGRIEQEMLMIYKMPEETLYDSIETSSLSFYGDEEHRLSEGIVFQNLTEVFEFLENSMS